MTYRITGKQCEACRADTGQNGAHYTSEPDSLHALGMSLCEACGSDLVGARDAVVHNMAMAGLERQFLDRLRAIAQCKDDKRTSMRAAGTDDALVDAAELKAWARAGHAIEDLWHRITGEYLEG